MKRIRLGQQIAAIVIFLLSLAGIVLAANITNFTSITDGGNESSASTLANVIKPELDIRLIHPGKVTRGSAFMVAVNITNRGHAAGSLKLKWQLPFGLEILEERNKCRLLERGESCVAEAYLSPLSAALGKHALRIVVTHD